MRFAIASGFGWALSYALRLKAEGHETLMWVNTIDVTNKKPNPSRNIGEGLVPRTDSWEDLLEWAKEGGPACVMVFDTSGMGEKADEARKAGVLTLGGGKFMDKLESSRLFGFKVAEGAGGSLPPFIQGSSLTETIAWAREEDCGDVYFKSDRYLQSDATYGAKDSEDLISVLTYYRTRFGDRIRHIVQEKVPGVALSTGRWWNGRAWVGRYLADYEHKKFMNDEVGASTGCSFNAVFWYKNEPLIAKLLGWEKLTETFRANEAAPGWYDINAILSEDAEKAYFLEWTPRFGYDSEPTASLLCDDLGATLYAVAAGGEVPDPSDQIAYSVRLSVPPYPWEYGRLSDNDKSAGIPVGGELGNLYGAPFIAYGLRARTVDDAAPYEIAGADGLVGLVAAVGGDIESLGEETIEAAKEIRVQGLQYRTDGATVIAEDAADVDEAGHEVHPGLLGDGS